MGASSIDVELGVTTPTVEKVEVKQQIAKSAEKVILVADHGKFGKRSFAKICPLGEFDCIITDSALDAAILDNIQKKGIQIHTV